MNEYEKIVDRTAQAIYAEAVAQAKKVIDDFGFDCDDLVDIFPEILAESQTARTIVFGSYVEEKTIDLLKLHMRKLTKEDHNNLFANNGPFSTFSSRINVAYSLKWITEKTRNNLHYFRRIRNLFAHEAYKIDISDQRILSLIRNIDVDMDGIIKRLNGVQEEIDKPRIDADFNIEQEFLLKIIFLSGNAFSELLVGPVALMHMVHPHSLLSDWDNQPETHKRMYRNLAVAASIVLKLDDPIELKKALRRKSAK